MMRVPEFRYLAPTTVDEVARLLAEHGPEAMLMAGGTDLLPNLKRRQQTPKVVVGLKRVAELKTAKIGPRGVTLGAGITLADAARSPLLSRGHRAVVMAAGRVATPQIQNMGTLGGNLCLDTRCNYYDQSWDWRKAIDFCKKAPGPHGVAQKAVDEAHTGTCWVAPGSPRCWAVSSTDCAPALAALGASVTLVSAEGRRTIPVLALYNNDGMDYLAGRKPGEVLTAIDVPLLDPHAGWRSTYWKLRRRGSFDFPVLSVAAAFKRNASGEVEEARVVLGSVASCPIAVPTDSLIGKRLSDDVIKAFLPIAAKPARPLDNTDFHLSWRKRVVESWVAGALGDIRGDDPSKSLLARTAARLLPVAG